MLQSDIFLSVGENIQVGNQIVTVVDIEGDEIIFRVDSSNKQTHKQTSQEKELPIPKHPR